MHKNIKAIIDKIGKLYKIRPMKLGERGIYFQDTELKDTLLQPKSKVECELVVDENSNSSKLKVFLSREGSITVSKRKRKHHINPVIDIRRKALLAEFSKYNYVEAEIYGDEVILRGFDNASESKILDDVVNTKKNSNSNFKLIDLFKRLELKKEVRLSKEYAKNVLLAKASGDNSFGYEQVTFDYLFNSIEEALSSSSDCNFNLSSVRENLDIAMNMVSFCSGAGVLDKGFIDQGFTGVLAMDIEKDMVETYKANLGDHAILADLSSYDLSNLPVDKEPKLLVAGTPCQDFVRP